MGNSNVDDYLQKGIYGEKQTKPEERKKYLGTLRERIVVALTKKQVMENGVYPEVVQLMKEHPGSTLLLNGELDYSYLSDYIASANKTGTPFSIVSNKSHDTNIGLVLAYEYAIDKEEIFIEKQEKKETEIKKGVLTNLVNFLKK